MSLTVKEMVFKDESRGTSKKTGNPYHMLVLHDPSTLENISFFLREDSDVNAAGLKFRDKIKAEFSMEFQFGRLQPVLQALTKIG